MDFEAKWNILPQQSKNSNWKRWKNFGQINMTVIFWWNLMPNEDIVPQQIEKVDIFLGNWILPSYFDVLWCQIKVQACPHTVTLVEMLFDLNYLSKYPKIKIMGLFLQFLYYDLGVVIALWVFSRVKVLTHLVQV